MAIAKTLILIASIMLISLNGCAKQNKKGIEDIREIWVYDLLEIRGYTTAGVARRFHELETDDSISKFRLDTMLTDSMKDKLLRSAKTRRVFQEKTGQNLIFAQFVMKDDSIRNIIIHSTGFVDYFVERKAYGFTDDSETISWKELYYNSIIQEIKSHLGLKESPSDIEQ